MAKLQSLNSVPGKETIYVDVDDEITSIIDKVQAAKGKVVALVLPKRATVLQSIVNMKLLKRSAETASKNLVLVTTEAGLMPLAGAVGLHVASTPTSKPAIPPAPDAVSDEPESVDEPLDVVDGTAEDFDSKAAAATSVGALAAATNKDDADDIDESIDMSDEAEAAEDAAAAPLVKKSVKKNKKLQVPNFDSFRKKLALAIALLVLFIGGFVFASTALPKATITIKTNSQTIETNANLTLDTNTKTLSVDNKIVPATAQSQQKTATQQVAATGQQNNGEKASGTLTITNCSGSNVTVSAGSSVSASGHTYIIQSSVVVPDSNYTSPQTGSKCKSDGKASAGITALKGGADYNIAASSATLSGQPSSVTGQTSQLSGGTDDIKKIVSQSDIDNAASKMKAEDATSVKDQLKTAVSAKGLLPIATTFVAGDPQVTTSAKAGDAADTVTVTSVTTFTMLGVNKSDIKKFVEANVKGKLEKGKQVILDDGVNDAEFAALNPATATGASVSMAAKSLVGPQIDVAKLKTDLVGKKSGEVKSHIKQTPGVTDVQVKLSPFWVETVPKGADKVTITIDKAKD